MTTKKERQIINYQFEDSKQSINSIIIGNLLFCVLFIISDLSTILTNPRAQFCMITSIVFFILQLIYDWKSQKVNIILVSIYVISWFIEIAIVGFPSYLMATDFTVTKGVLFEALLNGSPIVYIWVRLLLVLPLIYLIWIRHKMLATSS